MPDEPDASPLTCGACRNSPATHLIVADLGGRKPVRGEQLNCKPCADFALSHASPGDHLYLYRLVPEPEPEPEREWGVRFKVGGLAEHACGSEGEARAVVASMRQERPEFEAVLITRTPEVPAGPWRPTEEPATGETGEGDG